MKTRFAASPTDLVRSAAFLICSLASANAATLTWDTTSDDGTTVVAGSGDWNLVAVNTVWNDGTSTNVIWSQTLINDASNAAVFAGADGTLNQYVVSIGSAATMAAESITFNNSGYQITGGTLSLTPTTTTNGGITVAAGKTATINSVLSYAHNTPAAVSVGSGGVLNLGGGTPVGKNPQWQASGAGTLNLTAGTFTNNIGNLNLAAINLTGGVHALTPGNNNGPSLGNAAGQNVNYTVSGTGTLTVNNNSSGTGTAPSWLRLGFGDTAGNEAKLTVQSGGTVTVGNGKYGELQISGSATSNGKFDVQGGTVTIANGVPAANKIYLFKNGANAGYTATMTQSGGTVTANGIQFGGDGSTYDATSAASLQLSGGSLYVGLQGITRGTAAGALPATIRLQGGTLGASGTWSSSMDMQLGAATIRAANSGGTAQNITLSGILADDSGAGSLTKTGAGTLTLAGTSDNTFTGATTVSAGTLDLGKANAVSSSSSLTIANGAALALSTSSSTVPNLSFAGSGTLNLNVADGHSLTVNDTDGVTNSGAAGSVTINITGSAPANGTYTLIDYSGTLQGSGFSAYQLGTVPSGKSYSLIDSAGAVQLVVSSVFTWSGAESSEWSTDIIPGAKNWNLDGSPADYVDGFVVSFDDTATNKTVEITGADVSPQSVAFNSGVYTLQGGNKIAGPAPITVAALATLQLGSSDVLPDGAGTGNITLDGVLDLNGQSDTINALSGSGVVDNSAAATTSTLSVGANAGGNFSGTITDSAGTLALVKTGATDIILSGTNDYSGSTTVSQNRLFINASSAFSPNTAVTVNNGASLILNASGAPAFGQAITLASGSNLALRQSATLTNVGLPTSGGVKLNFDDTTTQAFSLPTEIALDGSLEVQIGGGTGNPGAVTMAGILSGTGSLVKTGPGLLALGGASTFEGGITIRTGTLEAKTTNTALGTGTLTLGGAGSTGATFITGRALANPIVVNTPDSGSLVIGANGNGSGYSLSGGITLNGDVTIQTFNNPANPLIVATGGISGGITGTGNVVLNNNGLSANVFNITTAAVNPTGSITLQGTATGNTNIGAVIGSNVTGITQNSATSTMVLSGVNTYACDLSINAGTVRISNNSNTANDVSTVTIAETGATLDLTYSGTDTVEKLIIGATEQASGVYGKVGSASPIIGIPQITGDGTLTVGSAGVGFASWITGTFANGQVPSGQQGPDDDPDGDGISNLIEFAIEGQDPTVPNSAIGSFDGSTLSFDKRQTPAITGISYAIEESTDLGAADAWEEVSGVNYINNPTTISYSLDPGSSVKNFIRLRVTQ
ncbi:MAG: autotransporter-associated beta strand repeat-containing protein [Akkermansiaceae bacterium]|nr:autotransporter-associated beta strand repeat-containing protein [Akkermansiaceae bacterium]